MLTPADYSFQNIWRRLGEPDWYIMDTAPITYPAIVITSPGIAEDITRVSPQYPYSWPKSPTMWSFRDLVGDETLLFKSGPDWKELRRRFNPGFQPKHLNSLLSLIIRETNIFVSRLEGAAKTGEVVRLGEWLRDLAIDVIGQVAIEYPMRAQVSKEGEGEKSEDGIITLIARIQSWTYRGQDLMNPFHQFNFLRPFVLRYYARKLDARIERIVRQRLAEDSKESKASRSIVHLAVKGETMDNTIMRQTIHQIKTFVFAGEDTTGTLMQWAFYEISKHPDTLARLRAEHDAVLGDDAEGRLIHDSEATLSRLEYTLAVVKETLRLHPPAATARMIPEGSGFVYTHNNEDHVLDGAVLYINSHIIHRSTSVWGEDAAVFRPERWLDAGYMASLPTGAFRPFERGPRNCIGQELALLEARVILALTVRKFGFEKVGLDGVGAEEVYDVSCVVIVLVYEYGAD